MQVAWSRVRSEEFFLANIAAVMQNFLLVATYLGLGSVWFSGAGGARVQEDIRSLLKIPHNIRLITSIPLGYPDSSPSTKYQHKLRDTAYWNEFDRTKIRVNTEMET